MNTGAFDPLGPIADACERVTRPSATATATWPRVGCSGSPVMLIVSRVASDGDANRVAQGPSPRPVGADEIAE